MHAMNELREDETWCYFHPEEVVVGVCPLCLNERLLILAEKQSPHLSKQSQATYKSTHHHCIKQHRRRKKPPSTLLPKILSFGSLLNRFEFQHKQFHHDPDSDHSNDSSASPEDSFISIRFEENGVGSWEKGRVSEVSLDHCKISWNHSSLTKETKSVVEHGRPRGPLRWRKRIGHLFQLSRWKGSGSHVGGKLEGVKVRRGWIRSLTKRRTKE